VSTDGIQSETIVGVHTQRRLSACCSRITTPSHI